MELSTTIVKWYQDPAQAGNEERAQNRRNWRLYNLHPWRSLSIQSSVRKDLGKFVSQRSDLGDHPTGVVGEESCQMEYQAANLNNNNIIINWEQATW